MFSKQARAALALVSVSLVLGFPVIGALHAFVPHTHTDAETEHAQLLGSLSLGLGRKDVVSVADIGGLLFLAAALEYLAALALAPALTFARAPRRAPAWAALHRGVLAYRRFG